MKLAVLMPDGGRRELVTEITEPRQVSAGAWACRIAIHGGHGDLGEIVAQDEARLRQAAQQMLRMLLLKMERAGHRFFIEEAEIRVAELRW